MKNKRNDSINDQYVSHTCYLWGIETILTNDFLIQNVSFRKIYMYLRKT